MEWQSVSRRGPGAALVLGVALALAAAPTAGAATPDGVYAGATSSGQPVRFLVIGGGTRIGDFSFGTLPTRCPGGFDASIDRFLRFKKQGRFSAFVEIPSGSEFVSASGRVRPNGRARGTVGTTSRTDCSDTSERWTAHRVRSPSVSGALDAGPALAGGVIAWGERHARELVLRLGALDRRTRVVFKTRRRFKAAFEALAASASSLAFVQADTQRVYAGPLHGPFRRISECGALPALDNSLVLYDREPQFCFPEGGDLRLRDLASGSDTKLASSPKLSGRLRMAGNFVAWLDEDLLRVFDRARLTGGPPPPGRESYAIPSGGVTDFDLQPDGKVALTRLCPGARGATCLRVEWYSPAEPRRHLVDDDAARPDIGIDGDRIVYVQRGQFSDDIVAVGLAEQQSQLVRERSVLAVFSREGSVRDSLVGGLDFDGRRVAFASQVSTRRAGGSFRRGRVRIEELTLGPLTKLGF